PPVATHIEPSSRVLPFAICRLTKVPGAGLEPARPFLATGFYPDSYRGLRVYQFIRCRYTFVTTYHSVLTTSLGSEYTWAAFSFCDEPPCRQPVSRQNRPV